MKGIELRKAMNRICELNQMCCLECVCDKLCNNELLKLTEDDIIESIYLIKSAVEDIEEEKTK